MRTNGTLKTGRKKEAYLTAQTGALISRYSEIKKSADLSRVVRGSAFLMRPRLMERSEHKSAVELILDIKDVKDLTPKSQGVRK